jgi:hypothetical protein
LNFPVLIKLNSHWTNSFNSTWVTEREHSSECKP